MMKFSDFDGVVIEASENALSHQIDTIYSSWQLKAIKLGKFLNQLLKYIWDYIEAPNADSVIVRSRNEESFLLRMDAK